MGKKGERLDTVLVNKGFFESKTRAQTAIMEGKVLVDNVKITKPGTSVSQSVEIRLIGEQLPYVSRGGLKLEKALDCFHLDFKNKTVLDVGASTGGFTDCALQNGAKKVFAVDVGYGQLAWKLRQDPRVVNIERKNARYLTFEDIGEKIDFIIIDVSFISLEKVISVIFPLLKEGGKLVALIKPQFEAGREQVEKGVIKSPGVHLQVLNNVIAMLSASGFRVLDLTFSPVKGPKGNIEYLVYALKGETAQLAEVDASFVVDSAWQSLCR